MTAEDIKKLPEQLRQMAVPNSKAFAVADVLDSLLTQNTTLSEQVEFYKAEWEHAKEGKVEVEKAYEHVKDTMQSYHGILVTLLEEFDNHADGTSDATALEKFCNEMIGKYNGMLLKETRTLVQQNAALEKERDEALRVYQVRCDHAELDEADAVKEASIELNEKIAALEKQVGIMREAIKVKDAALLQGLTWDSTRGAIYYARLNDSFRNALTSPADSNPVEDAKAAQWERETGGTK